MYKSTYVVRKMKCSMLMGDYPDFRVPLYFLVTQFVHQMDVHFKYLYIVIQFVCDFVEVCL